MAIFSFDKQLDIVQTRDLPSGDMPPFIRFDNNAIGLA